ncbi:hypothetical protein ACFFMN_43235 [Planobispora siamensis]|uniref:DUF4259 domain-containing protein n=1 Tax=Planobispora siamensis TaxID=936338 RepID=A0A8J3WPU6_9ACTN|nr:hypothetical protein [Planobispora siamensis]GIH97638.1 hypothetical protein Psi01_82680 [Planobispora siamensis]
MGIWGPGNFEEDAAAEHLSLHLIARQSWDGAQLPETDTIREWKKTYMATWDSVIDNLQPRPEYRTQRREVLVRTFDQLAELAARLQA